MFFGPTPRGSVHFLPRRRPLPLVCLVSHILLPLPSSLSAWPVLVYLPRDACSSWFILFASSSRPIGRSSRAASQTTSLPPRYPHLPISLPCFFFTVYFTPLLLSLFPLISYSPPSASSVISLSSILSLSPPPLFAVPMDHPCFFSILLST